MPGRIEGQEVRHRSLSGRTSEGTVLLIRMMPRIVVVLMGRRVGYSVRGTEFQLKRRAVGGHETDGDIGTKQQRAQHDEGRNAKAPAIEKSVAHTP